MTQKTGSPAAKIILLLLADRADERHSCWPSQNRLAEESEQSVESVRRHIRGLEDRGLISTERRTVPGQKRATNRYVLAVDGASTGQSDRHISTGQTEDLPVNQDGFYRSPVTDEPSVEPSLVEPPDTATGRFDEFWANYPRKVGKGAARKAWAKAVKEMDPEDLIRATVEFAHWLRRERTEVRFIPHPATWLNQERWADERMPSVEPESNIQAHMRLVNALGDDVVAKSGYPEDTDCREIEGGRT